MEVITFLLACLALYMGLSKRSRVTDLENKIYKIEKRLRDLESSKQTEPLKVEPIYISTPNQTPTPVQVEPLEIKKVEMSKPHVKMKKNKNISLLNRFLENGTGIIGVLILVMGMAFLGIYSALTMTAFPRFVLFILFSAALFGGSYFIEKKMKWIRLSLWLKSASGAIFLFSCIGSAGIEGLQWVDNPISGLMLVLVGILLNILLGQLSKKEVISSVHLLLSLVALSIAPATMPTLFVAATVTFYGIFLTYKKKWDKNLIIIISLFAAYHLYWNFRMSGSGSILTLTQNTTALLLIVSVTLFTLFSHYRKIYSVEKFEVLPFLTHFLNWCFLALGIYMYNQVIPFEIIMFSTGSLIALTIARRAKTLNIKWLQITDTLVANLLMILAVISFYPKGVNPFFISALLLLESIIFLIVVCAQKERLLSKIAYYIIILFGSSLLVSNWFSQSDYKSLLFIILIVTFGILYYIKSLKSPFFLELDNRNRNILSLLFPASVFAVFTNNPDALWSTALFMVLISPIIIFRQKLKNRMVFIAFKIIFPIIAIITWSAGYESFYLLQGLLYYLPIFIVLGLMLKYSYSHKKDKFTNLYPIVAIELNLLIVSYLVLNPISSFLPGFIWLLIILSNIIISNLIISKKLDRNWLHRAPEYLFIMCYIVLFFFFSRHLIVHIHSNETLLIFKTKHIFEFLTITLLTYWITSKNVKVTNRGSLFLKANSLVLEIALLFTISTIIVEVNMFLQPIIFILMAIGSLILKLKDNKHMGRLRAYSILFSWISAIYLATSSWFNNRWLSGLITIIFFCFYLVLLKRYGNLKSIKFPKYQQKLSKIITAINSRLNIWVFYPFFTSVALFILFTFNQNIITLFFVLLSLIIFILSMVLKEENFKIISLLGLGGCLLRMIFVDLSNSGTITRALVFIGVGLVMVVMNIIYMRFNRIAQD